MITKYYLTAKGAETMSHPSNPYYAWNILDVLKARHINSLLPQSLGIFSEVNDALILNTNGLEVAIGYDNPETVLEVMLTEIRQAHLQAFQAVSTIATVMQHMTYNFAQDENSLDQAIEVQVQLAKAVDYAARLAQYTIFAAKAAQSLKKRGDYDYSTNVATFVNNHFDGLLYLKLVQECLDVVKQTENDLIELMPNYIPSWQVTNLA